MRTRSLLVLVVVLVVTALTLAAAGSAAAAVRSVVRAGGPDPGTYWELVNGEYVKKYKPLTIEDTGGPANWQTRQPLTGLAPQYDLERVLVGRVQVDPDVVARIPLGGLSTLPADPSVIGPAGVTLDPADYADVLQVDLVLGAPLSELTPGQPIGFSVLRAVAGQPTFNGPGTEFHGMSQAERFATNSGLARVSVDGATNRFVGTPTNTILFLMGDRARFWIPFTAAQGTTALQGNAFQPGAQVSDTSTGEPGSTDVLTPIDLAKLPTTRLATRPRQSSETQPVATSGGTNETPWIVALVVGILLIGFAAAVRFVPALATGSTSTRPRKAKKAAKRKTRKRSNRAKDGPATQIDPPDLATLSGPVVSGEPSVLQYTNDLVVIGDIAVAAGEPKPPQVRMPKEPAPVDLPTIEEPVEVPQYGGQLPDSVPGPPTTMVTGDLGLAPTPVRPCEPERIAWTGAQQACDQARFEAAAAEADAADARAELDRLRAEYPPLDWSARGSLSADMDTGEHVDDLDLRLGDFAERRAKLPSLPPGAERAERSRQTREDARQEYEDYQAKAGPLRERVRKADEARARAAEACAKAAEARAAYERCIGLWSPRAPEPKPVPKGRGPSPTPVAPPPVTPPAPKARTPAPGGTGTRGYEPPKVTSPGPPVQIPTPPTPPGGCTQDLVRETCPREKFRIGRTLVLRLLGSDVRDDSWAVVTPGFAQWLEQYHYAPADRELGDEMSTEVEIAGEDVGPLLGQAMWRGLRHRVQITALVRFEEVTMACERTWPCVNGAYGSPITTTRRVRQQRYTAPPQFLGDRNDAVDPAMVGRFLSTIWKPYAQGEEAIARFVERCH